MTQLDHSTPLKGLSLVYRRACAITMTSEEAVKQVDPPAKKKGRREKPESGSM